MCCMRYWCPGPGHGGGEGEEILLSHVSESALRCWCESSRDTGHKSAPRSRVSG